MSFIGVATCLNPDLEADIIRTIESDSLPLQVIRRCRDATELLSIAKAHLVQLVAVDTEMLELEGATVQELAAENVAIIAFAPLEDVDQLNSRGGISVLAKADPRVEEPEQSEAARLLGQMMSTLMPPPPPNPREEFGTENADLAGSVGQIIAFWGPVGAPGKSTLALNIASRLRNYGRVLLVDADTVESSLVQMLGIALDTSGVVTGCRLAEQGKLKPESFPQLVTRVGFGVDLLTGLTKAERWREVGQHALSALLEMARINYRWILVDLASGADDQSDLLAAMGPTRYGAALGTFDVADLVVEVGLADPVGIRRLLVNHNWAREQELWSCPTLAVVNRGRASVGGANWRNSIVRVVAASVPNLPVVVVREAGEDFDRALVAACDVMTANPHAGVLEDLEGLQNEIYKQLGLLPRRGSGRKKLRENKLLKFKRGEQKEPENE